MTGQVSKQNCNARWLILFLFFVVGVTISSCSSSEKKEKVENAKIAIKVALTNPRMDDVGIRKTLREIADQYQVLQSTQPPFDDSDGRIRYWQSVLSPILADLENYLKKVAVIDPKMWKHGNEDLKMCLLLIGHIRRTESADDCSKRLGFVPKD